MAFLDEIQALLVASTAAGGATGWPLYLGHLPDSSAIGDRAVAAIDQTGFRFIDRVNLEQPGLQIIVRGAPINQTSTGYQDAQDRAALVAAALRGYVGQPSTAGARLAGVWNESGPFFTGFDDNWRPTFSANFRAIRETT